MLYPEARVGTEMMEMRRGSFYPQEGAMVVMMIADIYVE